LSMTRRVAFFAIDRGSITRGKLKNR